MLQALLTSLNGPQPNRGLQGGSHGAGPQDDPIETSLMEALSCLQARPNFHEIVSTTNDYHQTLAHLAILYDYPSLLGRLVEWHIDLTIADVNGLTALHCAYMKGNPDSVRILRRGGASVSATNKLGRTPSELQPEGLKGFDLDIEPDAELAAKLDVDVHPEGDDIDEQLRLGVQFSALDLEDNNDPGHGQSDSEDDASEDEENPDSMAVDSLLGGNEGDGGGVTGGWWSGEWKMNKSGTQLLNEYGQQGHTIQYEEFLCDNHSQYKPQYGCKVWVNGHLAGTATYVSSKEKAKEGAARATAEFLVLI